jgi:hypothetical protein
MRSAPKFTKLATSRPGPVTAVMASTVRPFWNETT